MLGALAQTDEGDVRPFPRRHRSDVLDLDLARDHLVPERGDDRRDERQTILALVRDQNTEMLGLAVAHLGSALVADSPTQRSRKNSQTAPRAVSTEIMRVLYPLPVVHNRPFCRDFDLDLDRRGNIRSWLPRARLIYALPPQTVSGHSLVHFTFFPDTGAVHFHEDVHGKAVAVPLDGTGPTYTANFWFSDTESIRSVKSGDLLVEQDTDFQHVVARGSDGSRVLLVFHAHFTVNANGETTVEFVTDRLVCT
jgi:PAS domain-containing protein